MFCSYDRLKAKKTMDSTFVIKNARIIDPGQQIDRITNIAVIDGKVHSLGDNIDLEINNVLDARECIVTPGWIDSHVHCYEHSTPLGINVDRFCLARGVTTVVDAGSAGSDTFPGLQKFIIEQSKTRVYVLLHIASHGLASAGRAGVGSGGECDSLHKVDTEKCLSRILECHDQIVGVKVRLQAAVASEGKNEIEIYRRALDCAKRANVPLMTHHVESTVPTQRKENEDKGEEMGCPANLRPGDIYTHCFHGWHNSILDNRLGKLTIHPDVLEAKERGVYFDVGHGWGSFHWGVAEQCAKLGFFPDTISTDIHIENINGPVYDLATVMSKLLCVGMPINEVIKAVTETPANAIHRGHLIGSLRVGRDADITVCRIEECDVEMEDCSGQIRKLKQRIVPLKVWRAGKEYSIIDIESWPNKANWVPLASNLDRIEIKDFEKPYYLQ